MLFQSLALQRSMVEALSHLPVRREWRVLDVGCGGGTSLLQLVSFGLDPDSLYGIDIVPDRIQEARHRLPGAHFTCGDASKMEYASDSFDLVLESTMFLQITDSVLPREIAAEMIRVTRPSGFIMLTDWRYGFGQDYVGVSSRRIRELFQVGKDTTFRCRTPGALVPPVGRWLSRHLPSLYFPIQRVMPALVGQITTVLQRVSR